ncbi:hypothetical protein VP01_2340g4 [Puccinia sorghi]|uniref:Integrase catalytic domain-containing protein n=1 Tax=Puccinia sorghi TaxID=27349 RepID=A0A0L6V7B7_9BASI|nr:hypothetical protein VP01_2340g4 [Puccinia sorghi]
MIHFFHQESSYIRLWVIRPCDACAVSKVTRGSFHSRNSKASKPFEEIHLDIFGAITPASREGHQYFVTIVDSCTRFCSAIPLKNKSEVSNSLTQALDLEARRIGYYPTVIHSDCGTEFINHTLTLNQIPAHKSKKSPFEFQSDSNSPICLGTLVRYNEELRSYRVATETGKIINSKHLKFLDFPASDEKTSDLNIDDNWIESESNIWESKPAKDCSEAVTLEEGDSINSKVSRPKSEPDSEAEAEDVIEQTLFFRTKPQTLSAAEKKKAQLCIQGFSQIPGFDYGNTFSPTGKFNSLLIVLMLAIDKKLAIRQFDVKSAFLFAPLKENLFIKTPEGSKQKAPFLKLKKSLYGIKQASANWFETFTSWFEQIFFKQLAADPCVFIHKDRHSIIFFHIDDLIVVGEVDQFEKLFLARFPNSSAHDPDTILGMDLTVDHEHIKFSQEKLIKKELELAGINELATAREREEFNKLNINYRTHTGILNYLACRTCPDLAPPVSILSSFNHAPGIKHWKQVVHYYSRSLKHFTDATWADDLETCPVAWNTELNVLSDGVQENRWIKFLVEEIWNEKFQPTHLHVENQGLIEKLKKFGSNSQTKHIDIKMKMLREMKKNNEILVTLIPSEEMIADALTKPSNHESLSCPQERGMRILR